MTMDELAAAISESSGMSKADASKAVGLVTKAISGALSDGDKVALAGFGSFEISHRPERKGRNPRSGEEIKIAASNAVKFKPAKALKDAVNS